jgi:hypothetical protein
MKMQDLKAQWEALDTKKDLAGGEAMAAVSEDGYALRYVSGDMFAVEPTSILERLAVCEARLNAPEE